MSHDHADHHDPSQARFIGWLAMGLIVLTVLFPLLILIATIGRPAA